MSALARWWRWLVARYNLVGWREPTGPQIARYQQTLYWRRSYTVPHD